MIFTLTCLFGLSEKYCWVTIGCFSNPLDRISARAKGSRTVKSRLFIPLLPNHEVYKVVDDITAEVTAS